MDLDDAIATVVPGLRADGRRHLIVSGTHDATALTVARLALILSEDRIVGVSSSSPPLSATPHVSWAQTSPERAAGQTIRALLRQDPDCIVVHGVIDDDLMKLVVAAAETGHQLVVATTQTLDEIGALEAAALAPFSGLPLLCTALLVGDDGATLRSREPERGAPWGLFVAPTIIDVAMATITAVDGDDDATAFADVDQDEDDDDEDEEF